MNERALELDRLDVLAPMRSRFHVPDGMVYLDGNSLGLQPKAIEARMARAIETEWREHLITGWNRDGWVDLPIRCGERIARLVGAPENSVRVTDSTSVNVFKVLAAALQLKGNRGTVLSDNGNFPTDLYVAERLIASMPEAALKLVSPEEVEGAISGDVAVLMLTQVDYRTGRRHDMARLTAKAHAAGALVIWDLAHSAGAFPVDLAGCKADFAVGCGYKYLNGGPGAPAFLFVRGDHAAKVEPLLGAWFGHASPFAFETGFRAAEGVDRFRTGTPPVLSLIALDAALDLWDDVDLAAVEEKSAALTGFFIECVERFAMRCGLEIVTPRNASQRGSHVSLRHEQAYPVMQALIARGVIGDMRAPDFLRFGFAPLYNSFSDVAEAARILEDILSTRAWDAPQFHRRNAVT